MARPRTFDETEVLDRAVQVFWTHGYEGTSVTDLEAATGLGRQSLYNAFGDKRQLFVRALQHYHRAAAEGRAGLKGTGLDAIAAFFATSIDFLTGSGERRGCFLTKARLEAGDQEGVPAVCRNSEASIRAFLRERLDEAEREGSLRVGAAPEVAAGMLATWAHGLSAAAAAGADRDSLVREAGLLVEGLRPRGANEDPPVREDAAH